MITFLAQAAREARVAAGRKPIHIAVSGDESDPSTIYRFEKGQWPRNPDAMVAMYAEDLGIAPVELWARATELWREFEASQPGRQAVGAARRAAQRRSEQQAEGRADRQPRRKKAQGD